MNYCKKISLVTSNGKDFEIVYDGKSTTTTHEIDDYKSGLCLFRELINHVDEWIA